MLHKNVLTYLDDILDSAKAIGIHTEGITMYDQFIANSTVYRAVERELTIIAEAVSTSIELTHTRQIVGLRNRIVHDYANTNYDIVWGVVVKHINPLIAEIEELIKKYE